MSDIVLVHDDQGDWIGLYVDGILMYENHSIESAKLLDLLGIEHEMIYDVDLSETGHLPSLIDDVPGYAE